MDQDQRRDRTDLVLGMEAEEMSEGEWYLRVGEHQLVVHGIRRDRPFKAERALVMNGIFYAVDLRGRFRCSLVTGRGVYGESGSEQRLRILEAAVVLKMMPADVVEKFAAEKRRLHDTSSRSYHADQLLSHAKNLGLALTAQQIKVLEEADEAYRKAFPERVRKGRRE